MLQYDSAANQIYQLLHYAFAVWVLYWTWPRFIFAATAEDPMERAANRIAKATFFYIAVGYFLVLTHLYEVLGLSFVLLLLFLVPLFRAEKAASRRQAYHLMRFRFYDLLETGMHIRRRIDKLRNRRLLLAKQFRESLTPGGADRTLPLWRRTLVFAAEKAPVLLFLTVSAGAAYIRFYDTVTSAVPQMSDSWVHMAWAKYIEERMLFHDGFYPAGFHITLANLHKFSAIDQLYMIKDIGPTVTLGTMIMLYFVVSRLSGNRFGGIVAAALYGWVGFLFLQDSWMERQSSANSQEFSLLFVLPAVYFTVKYLTSGKRERLTALLACCSVAGMSHELGYAYLDLGVACVVFAACLIGWKSYIKRSLQVAAVGVVSAAITAFQLLLVRLGAKPVTNTGFLTSQITIGPVPIHPADWLALAGLVLVLAVSSLPGTSPERRISGLAVAAFGAMTFFLYIYGGAVTHSTVIYARSKDLWGIAAPLVLGFAAASLFRMLKFVPKPRAWQPIVSLALLAVLLVAYPLKPVYGYKLMGEDEARVYLKIAGEYRPKTWTIFGVNEYYDLALENGFHQYLQNFVDWYDPTSKNVFPTRYGAKKPDVDIAPDTFVVLEKKVYLQQLDLGGDAGALIHDRVAGLIQENRKMAQWISAYEKTHGFKPKVFFEDGNIVVYEFHLKDNPLDNPDALWNGPVPLNRHL